MSGELLLVLFGLWMADPVSNAAADPKTVATGEIRFALIEDLKALEHADFRIREAASERIVVRRLAAVAPLAELAQSGRPEASIRAFELLRQLHSADDEATYEAVESVYDALIQGDNIQAASRAEAAIDAQGTTRHRRALAAFRKLGGLVRFHVDEDPDNDAPPPPIKAAMINRHWTGGDEGLKYLRRSEDFQPAARLQQRSALYVIKGPTGAKISPEALTRLKADLQNIVAERGPAFMGVQPSTGLVENGLVISRLVPGGPGDAAGLQSEDVILEFDGVAIPNFETLVEQIGLRQPGDIVTVIYQRDGEEKCLTVELDEFKI